MPLPAVDRRTFLGAAPAAAIAAAALPSLPGAAAVPGRAAQSWYTGWGRTLVQAVEPERLDAGDRYRETVRPGLAGAAFRIVLNNEHGDQPLRLERAQAALAARKSPILFGGLSGIVVPPGAKVTSDAVELPVRADSQVELELELGGPFVAAGAERGAQPVGGWHMPRNGSAAREIAPTFLSAVEVSSADCPVLVILGDTKSAGPETWPAMLTQASGGRLGIVNRSVYAGHLALGPAGASALARLDRDVLATTGASHVLVFTGNNDLIQPGMLNSRGQPSLDPALAMSADALIALLAQCIDRVRSAGMKAIGGTWLPYEGVTIAQGYATPEKLAKRDAINAWIRKAGSFDVVIDFDAALRDPARPQRLSPAYDEGNHFTPNAAGYRLMAEAAQIAILGTS